MTTYAVDNRSWFPIQTLANTSLLGCFLKMPAACDSMLEDIEDIVSAEDLKPHDRRLVKRNIFPKVRKRDSRKNTPTDDDDPPSDR